MFVTFSLVVTVYFESSGYEVVENEGPVTVCVLREGEIAEAIVIQVTTSELSPVQAVGRFIASTIAANTFCNIIGTFSLVELFYFSQLAKTTFILT